ncbi:CinA family protein [Levilactobacillus brevis]|uniref:Damage-inducible protein n=2 Tax=Levilactobacillus brevis TaxID=1580 RepID=A0A5B7Y016_LEVBR|nr:CinA family protein [Levilactobacillus brevis]QCZ53211.1 damage-inducible protein [Levilactobacillus brevis]
MSHKSLAVVEYLKMNNLTISAAESLTGGLFQSTIVKYPGASKIFEGGFVTYSEWAKTKLLGVPADEIKKFGVVSNEVARSMARGCQHVMGSDIGVGFTGAAGPTTLNGKAIGTAWIGFHFDGKDHSILVNDSSLGRNDFREYCVNVAFKELSHILNMGELGNE